jgi:predicted metal-binding membrane protein
MTAYPETRTPLPAAVVAATLALAAACWVVAVRQMHGMDMGVETTLGSFAFFLGAWVPMMAAMMLPGAMPALVRHGREAGRVGAAPLFAASYLAVWAAVGIAVFALYRPHGTLVAGALTVAAGLYELTPLKRRSRRRCQERVGSGFEFGIHCVGSSIGLMAVLLALGVMSITWMAVVAALVIAQKLVPPVPTVDLPLALAIVAFGIVVAVAPSSIPGLTPAM